jgi:hypothetical protein
VDHLAYLLGLEFVLGLDLVVELSTLKQFHHDIEGVVRLEDFMELHAAAVIECPHYFYFLYEALLSLVLTVSCFLREGLDGKVFPDLQFFSQIHRGEVALADFLFGLELLVEPSLVEFSFEYFSDQLKVTLRAKVEIDLILLLFHCE